MPSSPHSSKHTAHTDFVSFSHNSIKMYVHLHGQHIPRYVRLEKRQLHSDQQITCCDVYTIATLLPISTVSSICLKKLSYATVSLLWVHCVYEVVHRVRKQVLCTFPHAFTVIYVSSAAYIAVAMCINAVFAGIIQCFVSIALIVRYFILQHSVRVQPAVHTP